MGVLLTWVEGHLNMSRRVVALGDRFDSMKKKKPSAGTDKRRSGKNIEIRGKRSNKLDQKRGKRKTQQQQPKKKKPVPKKKPTAEELDAELEKYAMANEERAKDYLDAQLEEYNRKR